MSAPTTAPVTIFSTSRCDSDDKRMHIPALVRATCPKCGHVHERDYSRGDHYFSYPTFNRPLTLNLYCPECECEWTVLVQINVSLTLVPEEAPK